MHALIVAGPSGAGKSAFLHELAAGRVAPDIRCHLPDDLQSWPLVYCNHPEHWQPFLSDPNLARTGGLTIHYDISWKWRMLRQDLARDPFWQVLDRCDAVTLVFIRTSSRRLLDQWSHAHLRMRPWEVHSHRFLAKAAWLLLRQLRRLRIAQHPRFPERKRYPRSLRFLKRADHILRGYRMVRLGHFDFYRQHGAVEWMVRSWNDVVATRTTGLPVTRIDISPAPATKIGKTFGWCIEKVEWASPAPISTLASAI